MISTAVRKLGGCNIQDPFSGLVGDQMEETEQILTGITEAHAAADPGFVIGSGTGHVEGDHALVLIPDVDHAVEFFIRALYGETGEESGPVFFQFFKSGVCLFCSIVAADHGKGRSFFYDT